MVPKQDAPQEVQLLVNTAMIWAEEHLRVEGRIPAAAVWLPRNTGQQVVKKPELRTGAMNFSIAQQERDLADGMRDAWRRGELTAVLLAAPVLYGRSGSRERTEAVRLHIEAAEGYCADVLMPYRIRAGGHWRRNAGNRVHFTHPVAQQSDSRFAEPED